MIFEKQILGVLRNEVGSDACNNIVLSGDMDNNGWNDLVVCGNAGSLAILKNGENFDRWQRVILDDQVSGIGTAGVLCDLTGNGYLDIVLAGDSTSDAVIWYENPGDLNAKWEKHVAFTTGCNGFTDMVLADNLLGDGRPCLLMVNTAEAGANVLCAPLPADPKAPWAAPMVLAEGLMDENTELGISAPSMGLAAGDIDGDGHMEFVCGNYWFKREGAEFVKHAYCTGKVSCRIALGDIDGKDDLSIVVCESAAVSAYELSGATLSVFRKGLEITDLWEEQIICDNICDCGSLIVGSFTGNAKPEIIVGEIGLEGLTRSLHTFKKPAHLGGFRFGSDTTRYLSAGEQPTIRMFQNVDGLFIEQVICGVNGLYVGSLTNVLHGKTLSLVGAPKLGSERWALHCYTAR